MRIKAVFEHGHTEKEHIVTSLTEQNVLHLVITTCYESSAQCTLFIFHVWSLQQAVHHA